jgi:hypothetical protein
MKKHTSRDKATRQNPSGTAEVKGIYSLNVFKALKLLQAVMVAARWFRRHLNYTIPVIIITENVPKHSNSIHTRILR